MLRVFHSTGKQRFRFPIKSESKNIPRASSFELMSGEFVLVAAAFEIGSYTFVAQLRLKEK